MKNYLLRVPLLLYLFPFVYLSLLADYTYHSIAGFGYCLVATTLLGFYGRATNQTILLLVGNVITAVLSYICSSFSHDWHSFYQPYNPQVLTVALSILYLIPQLIGIFWAEKLTQNRQKQNC